LEVALRQGVTFHNGEVFDAEIVKLNWEENTRSAQPHRTGPHMTFKPGSRLQIIDAQTVRFLFPDPDGAALVKLSAMHLYTMNKAVQFVPYVSMLLNLAETAVTEQHWSVRQTASKE
jgi:ABC-type transport system substrate-binding protein